jgi:hypothetical protein
MRTQNAESWFLSKVDEEKFAEGLQKTLISDYSNPSREGCPDTKTIRALAFHKRIGAPESFERITNHMAECSACVRDALGYAEEYQLLTRRRRTVSLALGLVATLVLTAALWAIWRTQTHGPTMAKSPATPTQPAPRPSIADAGTRVTNTPAITQFTPVMIELPLSWRGAALSERPIILPRGCLQLEIRLPLGSPDGTYKLRISDASGSVLKKGESATRSVNGICRIQIPLDTSDLSSGNFNLNVLEPDAVDWASYSVTIK